MATLATLAELRQYLGVPALETRDDARLTHALKSATVELERVCRRKFLPYHATLLHTVTSPTELRLTDDILEVTSLTHGNQTPIPLDQVVTRYQSMLRLIGGAIFEYDASPLDAVAVTGIWGWHGDWDKAWCDTHDTLQVSLSAEATVLTVGDADGTDALLTAPRFDVGQLLKVDEEYLAVLAVNTSTQQLVVLRGANGTTATTHALHTPLYRYQPPSDLVQLCLRVATTHYTQPDSANPPPTIPVWASPFQRMSV